jgi:hypothetical protein
MAPTATYDRKKVVSCFVSSGKGRLRVKQGQRHKPLSLLIYN